MSNNLARLIPDLNHAILLRLWPRALPLAQIIRAEIIGQAEFYAAHGVFPVDQAAFIQTEFDKWQN